MSDLMTIEFRSRVVEGEAFVEAPLSSIATYKNGLAMQNFRPEGNDPGLPVVKIKELGLGYCPADCERCSTLIDESVRLKDGDLVFSWSGTLMAEFWTGGPAGLNQHLFKVTSEKYPKWFYYLWTKHHLQDFIRMAKNHGTTMGHIKRSALDEAIVRIPDEEMFEALNSIFEPMVDAYLANAVESKKLDQLAVILLPKLMSGEIDVSKVDLTLLNNHLYESKTGGCRGHPLFRRCKLHGPLWSFEWIYHLSNTGEQLIAHRGSNQIIRFAPDRSSRDLLYRIQGHS